MYRKLALKDVLMTALAMPVIAIIVLAALPAQAQTYDPNYPVCIQTYGREGNYIDCRYTSMAQCRLSASGRAAQCLTNPYFGPRNSRQINRRRQGVN
jgi:Protein of unknown function (DUF3551)